MLKQSTAGYFVLLNLLIKSTAAVLFKTKKRSWFISLKMLKWSWDFFLLKLEIKGTAVNLFKTRKSCGFIWLKILRKSSTGDLSCSNSWQKLRLWIYLKQRKSVDLFPWKYWNKVPLVILFGWISWLKVRLQFYLKQRRGVDLFRWKCWNEVPLAIFFVEIRGKKYGYEFT